MEPVATRLKRLREAAVPPVTIRKMAAAIGLEPSSYNFYETAGQFKKPHIPMHLARKVAGVLADHGIDRAEVMALAGVEQDEPMPAELTSGQRDWLDLWELLSSEQRTLMFKLGREMVGDRQPPAPPPTMHAPARDYHA